ncbi:hypothetical protein NX059_010999 [Plenodomus lindquistii]|nr:hypothetical protein NX059_010999 [Plenodomus lindquistii]
MITWVRTFLDIDAVGLEPFCVELQSLHRLIREFETLILRQVKGEHKHAAAIQVKAGEIAATEIEVVETGGPFTSVSKITRRQNLQSEMPRIERELRQVQAATGALRDAFTRTVLTPLRTFSRMNEDKWQAKLDYLRSEIGKLREELQTQQANQRAHHGTIERLEVALDDRVSMTEEAERKITAIEVTAQQLQDNISAAEKKHNSDLVAHQLRLSEVTAIKTKLQTDLAAKMTELSLQETSLQTKYREKMNEKISALQTGKEKALLSQKQKYESQIKEAQTKTNQLAKAMSKNSELERRIMTMEKEKLDLEMAKVTLEKQLKDLRSRGKQMQSFEHAYEQIKQEFSELQSTHNDALYERDELHRRVEALKAAPKDSAPDTNFQPDSRHEVDKGRREKEHTRSIVSHWENQLKSRMAVLDKKNADLAACNAEIDNLRSFRRAEASSSSSCGPHQRMTNTPAGEQLLDAGGRSLDELEVKLDIAAVEGTPVDPAPNNHVTQVEPLVTEQAS